MGIDSYQSSKEFLKHRRPNEFSSSNVIEVGELDRVQLEYYLTTLNTRSQELEFETFAKKLCEKIICPNLLEQTGPVAGGDGKTDTQTFPVSEQNHLLWYTGSNNNSHKERWAFAVSTQKTWKAKCQKDVKKIIETDRGYVKVFCISNQSIKSNQRSQLEDDLTKEFSIDVRILDLSWILDEIFKNKLEFLAIETLSIPTNYKREVKLSADDYEKQNELDRLNNVVNSTVDAAKVTHLQIDLFLEIAILSKELEKPIFETQGLFDRAVRVAEEFGTSQQSLEASYQYAWAAFWWFEDFNLFKNNIEITFKKLTDDTNSENWEKIVNLLTIYIGKKGVVDIDKAFKVGDIYQSTLEVLGDIAEDHSRPSNALMANVHLYLLQLTIQFQDKEYCAEMLRKTLAICRSAQNLIGFPFEKIYKLFSELDIIFDEYQDYEEILDYFTEQSNLRSSEVKTARLQLDRGIKRLNNNKPYQAIKFLGKAVAGLNKKETYDEMTKANIILSNAYSKVGLQWASRASLLFSASLLTNYFHKEQLILPSNVKVFWQIAWKELLLGRIPLSLNWAELAFICSNAIDDKYIDAEKLTIFDGCIAHLLLNCSVEQIKEFECLPDILDKLQLYSSYGVLIYLLGYEDKFKEEFEVSDLNDHIKTLLMIRDADIKHPTSKILSTLGKSNVYSTKVAGCLFSVNFPNKSPFIELSESILTTIENFFSTSLIDKVYTKTPILKINIIGDDDKNNIISHDFKVSPQGVVVDIYYSNFNWENLDLKKQEFIFNWFCKFVLEILIKIFHVPDTEKFLETALKDDLAFTRSIAFSTCMGAIYNVMGKDSHKKLLDLLNGDHTTKYRLVRKNAWDHDWPKIKKTESKKFEMGDYRNTPKFDDPESIRHDHIGMSSLIKPELWDRAKWCGLAFSYIPNHIPTIFLMFESEGGIDVFMDLYSELSSIDEMEKLRLSIIRGISKDHPTHYRVHLTENPNIDDQHKLFMMLSRMNTMQPQTDQNWNSFEQEYKKAGAYNLSFGLLKNNQFFVDPDFEKTLILKKEIIIKNAWEVGMNDIDRVALRPDEIPLISEGVPKSFE